MKRECETCVRNKLIYCPISVDCLATDDKPYYQNKIMILEENWKLRKQLEEKENQQKEFIDWLESESKELIRDAGYHQRICLDILSKYKEITGKDINVSNKN